jgi:hypothetical protein
MPDKLGPFFKIAVPARKRQITGRGEPPMLPRYYVLNVEWASERRLRYMTVLASITGAPPDFPGKPGHARV